jgi:hypothetical protein
LQPLDGNGGVFIWVKDFQAERKTRNDQSTNSNFRELYEDTLSDPKAKFRTPVIVMEGSNHGQFASGTMPPNVATHDLPPDVTNTTAYQTIAKYTCSFISNTIANNTSSQQVLSDGYNSTGRMMAVSH